MSSRPKVQTPHERRVDRQIAAARRQRDAALRAESRQKQKTAGSQPPAEPYITCVGRGAPARPVPPRVQAWIDAETRDQLVRYRRIAAEMAALAPARERWLREFFERITGPRGFSVHAGTRRTIRPEELPARPARPWRVVW
jgi:hypothetical protein